MTTLPDVQVVYWVAPAFLSFHLSSHALKHAAIIYYRFPLRLFACRFFSYCLLLVLAPDLFLNIDSESVAQYPGHLHRGN